MRRLLLATALLVLVGAGCGAQGTEAPDIAGPGPNIGAQKLDFPKAGIRFLGPQAWTRNDGRPPLVVTLQAGTATISVWRYPRTEALPASRDALVAARDALVAETKKRDPEFEVEKARLLTISGARAVQILGTGRFDGRVRRVRSTHAFAHGAEVVIDVYARTEDFAELDRGIVAQVLRSLELSKPAA